MGIQTVGILSPGDMGQAIASVLNQHGLRTVAALDERSQRTRQLASEAKIEDVGSLKHLVTESDLILSVLVPAAASHAAAQLAEVIQEVGKSILYADCNAIAPHKVKQIEQIIQTAGGQFIDASIIGPPPRMPNRTRIYVSGEQAHELEQLRNYGLDIRVIGDQIGQASGLKMSYAALTKGLIAIGTQLLISAHRLNLEDVLWDELSLSQKNLLDWLIRAIPTMPPKAHRWVGEMEEIAATFGSVGLTELTFKGAAEIYELVKKTSLGKQTPEENTQNHSSNGHQKHLADIIAALSDESLDETQR